jgi:hypothetical protein
MKPQMLFGAVSIVGTFQAGAIGVTFLGRIRPQYVPIDRQPHWGLRYLGYEMDMRWFRRAAADGLFLPG